MGRPVMAFHFLATTSQTVNENPLQPGGHRALPILAMCITSNMLLESTQEGLPTQGSLDVTPRLRLQLVQVSLARRLVANNSLHLGLVLLITLFFVTYPRAREAQTNHSTSILRSIHHPG